MKKPTCLKDQAPWYKMFPDRWLSSMAVRAMTVEQRGIYIDLLQISWRDDGIRMEDIPKISRFIGCEDKSTLSVLEVCFKLSPTENKWRNALQEMLRVAKNKARKSSSKGGKTSRKNKNKGLFIGEKEDKSTPSPLQVHLQLTPSIGEGEGEGEGEKKKKGQRILPTPPENHPGDGLLPGPSKPCGTVRNSAEQSKTPKPPKIDFDSENGQFINITDKQRKLWETAYPAVNLDRQIAAAASWLLADWPKRRKVLYGSFLHKWFAREQDRPGWNQQKKPEKDVKKILDDFEKYHNEQEGKNEEWTQRNSER